MVYPIFSARLLVRLPWKVNNTPRVTEPISFIIFVGGKRQICEFFSICSSVERWIACLKYTGKYLRQGLVCEEKTLWRLMRRECPFQFQTICYQKINNI